MKNARVIHSRLPDPAWHHRAAPRIPAVFTAVNRKYPLSSQVIESQLLQTTTSALFAPECCIANTMTAIIGGSIDGGASSISVTVRVRPFTIREAAQLTKADDGHLFLGDGSLAAAPTPKVAQKGIKPVIKVVDERCL